MAHFPLLWLSSADAESPAAYATAGTAQVLFIGSATSAGAFSIAGSATVVADASTESAGIYTINGTSTFDCVGSPLGTVYSIAGSAAVSFVGLHLGVGVFSIDGLATVAYVGDNATPGETANPDVVESMVFIARTYGGDVAVTRTFLSNVER